MLDSVPVAASGTSNVFPEVHHVGMVVADCARSTRRLAAVTGRPAMDPFEDRYDNILVEGSQRTFSLRLSFIWLGNVLVELLEPMDAHSPHAAFLERSGEGFHHLGFRVEGLEAYAQRLEGLGMRRLIDSSVAVGASQWIYLVDPTSGGQVIELMAKGALNDAFFDRVDRALGLTS